MEGAEEQDGRIRRGQRTREAVVEAFLSLIEDGDPQPTARAIAARARVSLPAAGRWRNSLPTAERVATFVARRVDALETMAPVARAARLREPFSRQLRTNRDRFKKRLRKWIEETFAPELAALSPEERLDVVEAILSAGSFSAWSAWRDEQSLPAERAMAVLGLTVERLLGVGIRR